MNRNLIISIIEGYKTQLLNAEIKKDEKAITFLKEQINEGHRVLATMAVYE